MDQTRPLPRPYLRTPAIAPDAARIAFIYAGDVWIVDAGGGEAYRLTAHSASHFHPRWSHDSRQIAFGSNRSGSADLYVLPLDGGEIRRLTYHEAAATPECWAHDDSALYFSSDRGQQNAAIYRVGVAGGTPITWAAQPYEQLADATISPDGMLMALSVVRDRWWRRGPNHYGGADLWVCEHAPGAPAARRLSDTAGLNRWPLWAPGGEQLYFVSDRDGHDNLWLQPLEGGPPRQVTSFRDGRVLWPSISADGRAIVFERDFAIWRLDTRTGQAAPIDIHVRPDQKFTPLRVATYSREFSELALAPDGKKLALVAHGEVFADFADKETDKDLRQGPAFRVTNTPAREQSVAWSPDSRRLLYVSDRDGEPEVYAYDFAARAEARLTTGPKPKAAPLCSPDGAWIAYASGDDEIRLIDTRTGADRSFVRANLTYGGGSLAWSPDSRWVVFSAEDEHLFENLYVQRVDEERARQITFLSNINTVGPLWSPSGQFVIFTTGHYRAEMQVARVDLRAAAPFLREAEFEKLFEQKPDDGKRIKNEDPRPEQERPEVAQQPADPDSPQEMASAETAAPDSSAQPAAGQQPPSPAVPALEIVFEGIDRRLKLLTPVQIDGHALCISPDSRDLIFRATVMGKPNLWSMPLDEPRAEQPARQITASASQKTAAQFAPDGKSFSYLDGGQVVVRKFPNGEPTYPQYSAEVQIDFRREKWQIFNEAHRLLRDNFFDPTFGGLDWMATREQFAPVVAGAQTYGDLMALLNLMMGELRASHLGVGYSGSGPERDGYLGLLFDPAAQLELGRLMISSVLAESPAALAGIVAGAELLAVDGRAPGPETSLDELLQRTAGRRVRLRLSGPGAQPEREIIVRPLARSAYEDLCYRAWVQQNEAIVHAASGGRLGYVHIPQMSYEAYQQFLVDLDAEIYGKQGLLIDVRYNGGGHTATFFLDVLTRRSVVVKSFRGRAVADSGLLSGNRVLNRPTVLLTNERSYSNAEMFAETYRRLGIGKIVGRPTGGAVIWTWRPQLLDGASMGLPRMRVTTLDGEDLEGIGRPVDVDVSLPLGDPGRGRDPQLETAVRVLLEGLGVALGQGSEEGA